MGYAVSVFSSLKSKLHNTHVNGSGVAGDRRELEVLPEKVKEDDSKMRKQEAEVMKFRMDQTSEQVVEEWEGQREGRPEQVAKDMQHASLCRNISAPQWEVTWTRITELTDDLS